MNTILATLTIMPVQNGYIVQDDSSRAMASAHPCDSTWVFQEEEALGRFIEMKYKAQRAEENSQTKPKKEIKKCQTK